MDPTVAFIRRNARPLELLLFEHSRGQDRREQVLTALAAYQNDDGGFGWAIEPDNFSPHSTPIGTWRATTALRELDCYDRDVPLVGRAVEHLLATRRPDGRWNATDPSTNAHPHAPWWQDTGPADRVWGLNPTAALLGYLLRAGVPVADDVTALIERYVAGGPVTMTELPCALDLYDDLRALGVEPPAGFADRLARDIDALLERDPARWGDYVVRPSSLFGRGHREFAAPYAGLIAAEQEHLRRTRNPDGSWEPNWQWDAHPQEWAVARNWWKAILARDYLDFLSR
jgi:hypothetical protein